MIEHANIIYARNINSIGGVETYVYELAKKYKDYDIAVVCKTIAKEQKERLKKICKVYIHNDQKINCKVAIINWDTSIIDYITEDIWKQNLKPDDDRGIYQGIHADYTHPSQGALPQDPRIKNYLAITEDILHNVSKMIKTNNIILCRNPLKLEEEKPFLILVSPTRLAEEKGGDLMLKLANTFDKLKIKIVWFVLTTNAYLNNPIFNNSNVVYVKNRLDIEPFLKIAHWVVLPSRTEGDSYTFKEALYRGIPIVARHLPYFDEIGIKDGVNALFIDDNNVEEVAKKMLKPLKFNFEPIKDGYDDIMYKSKSRYEEEKNMKYLVEALPTYEENNTSDCELGYVPKAGEQFEVSSERLEVLLGENDKKLIYVKVIGEVKQAKEKEVEEAVKSSEDVEIAMVKKNGKRK